MDECIREGILAEFLSAHRAEVIDILLTEYDEEFHIANEKAISEQAGIQKGRQEGRQEERALLAQLYKLMQKDNCLEEYSKALEDPAYLEKLLKEYNLE